MNIRELLNQSAAEPLETSLDAQLQGVNERETKTGKPYREITFADAAGMFTLKMWNNHPLWAQSEELLELGGFFRVEGVFSQDKYGMDAKSWKFRPLNEGEIEEFLTGDPTTRKKQGRDWEEVQARVAELLDPRLKALADLFLTQLGDRFRRAAAARKNHHARRGGLLEHVAQMMRTAVALKGAYPNLNLDLIITGILFHDCGKLWENSYPERGFSQVPSLHGEMIGHIPLGLELINKLWRDLPDDLQKSDLQPPSEEVRLHLLHLVASHHGTHEFGSPTLPRTPEAIALHHIDNLDAKLEMMKDSYETSPQLIPGLYEKRFPLPAGLVKPLAEFEL